MGPAGSAEGDGVVGVAAGSEAGVEHGVMPRAGENAIVDVCEATALAESQVMDVDMAVPAAREPTAAPVSHGDGPPLGRVPDLGFATQPQRLARVTHVLATRVASLDP